MFSHFDNNISVPSRFGEIPNLDAYHEAIHGQNHPDPESDPNYRRIAMGACTPKPTRTRKPTTRKPRTTKPVPTDVSESNVALPSVPATLAKLADHTASVASTASVKPTTVNPSRGTTESTPALPFDEFATTHADSTPIRLADDRVTPETDAEASTDDHAGIDLDPSTFDITRHNGYISVHNTATNNQRTFKVETVTSETSPLKGKRILSLLTGPNNEADYKGFAFVDDWGIHVWKRFVGTTNERSQYEKFAHILSNTVDFSKRGLVFSFEGRCRRCNHLLTVLSSVQDGYGPICRKKV